MTDADLFGSRSRREEVSHMIAARSSDETTTDAITPTIILSMIVCPSIVALSVAYSC